VQALPAQAPDEQKPLATPVPDAPATAAPALDMLPPAPALPAPIAAFLAVHGAETDLSRVVARYDWQLLDHSGVAGRSAATEAAWPSGLPQLIKPLWSEYALTRDTLWDACFAAAETGWVSERSEAGRGTAGRNPQKSALFPILPLLPLLFFSLTFGYVFRSLRA
jgi:hypothetical protein